MKKFDWVPTTMKRNKPALGASDYSANVQTVTEDDGEGVSPWGEMEVETSLNSPSMLENPSGLQRMLTDVSKKYDRHGKGYLDETELVVRQMDTGNRGLFEPGQVLHIMESLQKEQQRSSEFIETIRKENKKNMTLRRLVFVLIFAIMMLATANIGTSFVAARLARDMKVNEGTTDLVSLTGERLGTTSKLVDIEINAHPYDENNENNGGSNRHRNLILLRNQICDDDNFTGNRVCDIHGVIQLEDAVRLYQQFCPKWPNKMNKCIGGGVSDVTLVCNGERSTIFGGWWIPPTGPTVDTYGYEYMMFPTGKAPFKAQQALYDPNGGPMQDPCIIDYKLGFTCLTSGDECIIFAAYDVDQCPGKAPVICGESAIT